MKNLRTSVLCTTMILFSICALAQDQKLPINEPDYNRPHLFDNLPSKIAFNPANFTGLLNKQAGSTISTSLSKDGSIAFEGNLVSSGSQESGGIESLVIRSTNFPGATLCLSKVTRADGSVAYTGRLLSLKHGDLFILQQTNGQYELIKKNFYDLVNE